MGSNTDFGSLRARQEEQQETLWIIKALLGVMDRDKASRDMVRRAATLYDTINDDLAQSVAIMDKVESLTTTCNV